MTDAACRKACLANTDAIGRLTKIVASHTKEIAKIRELSNTNLNEILSAIHNIRDEILVKLPDRLMPRDQLDAALKDLYNRTQSRDPDSILNFDPDIP